MPNKKTKQIKIRHLKCFAIIARELFEHPEYRDYEIEEAVLSMREYIPPTVKDVEKVIERIRFSYATHKYKYGVILGRELIDQQVLAKWRAFPVRPWHAGRNWVSSHAATSAYQERNIS